MEILVFLRLYALPPVKQLYIQCSGCTNAYISGIFIVIGFGIVGLKEFRLFVSLFYVWAAKTFSSDYTSYKKYFSPPHYTCSFYFLTFVKLSPSRYNRACKSSYAMFSAKSDIVNRTGSSDVATANNVWQTYMFFHPIFAVSLYSVVCYQFDLLSFDVYFYFGIIIHRFIQSSVCNYLMDI